MESRTDTTRLTPQEAALYLGQRITLVNGSYFIANPNSKDKSGNPILSAALLADFEDRTFDIKNFKLLLRPLADITEEELKWLNRITDYDKPIPDELMQRALADIKKQGIDAFAFGEELHARQVFEVTRYLLSRGFDLFNWIEQGKALDKTKLAKLPDTTDQMV
ncbi:hypothetical protein [Pontibacter burrus]|uniref:Uncharacterized protein n=1 Tax=Pontibacter burrus TaxID=2704466 RepID=A0A6B3LRI3_9BACT|nr:hypothetical protein [Pontibacter burrus]NEM96177.1 hypothetical protein [Pontibacter burrus]